ncbi:MAG TPA: glycosyltransferase [Ignavibacteriales bacterium]|nr:glycosyltransferase [Ignavibacteriales bacterium]
MKILYAAYPFAPVKEDTPGGAEQILLTLDKASVKYGFDSAVLARADSQVSGRLYDIPVIEGEIDAAAKSLIYETLKKEIIWALETEKPDLLHFHGFDFGEYLPMSGPPVLVTLHLPIDWYDKRHFNIAREGLHFNCVSYSQLQSGFNIAGNMNVISNGVPVEELSRGDEPKEDYAVYLGRICWEKGTHLAIEAAQKAGIKLIIAGQVFNYFYHMEYYEKTVKPLIDGDKVKFIGPVNFNEKKKLLSGARCLLQPSLAAETSSLIAMEAISCGTPVIAFKAGALPEIVSDGLTGFIVNDADGMAEAIGKADKINPENCKAAALQRFSQDIMINNYISLYSRILKQNTARKNKKEKMYLENKQGK